MAVFPPDGTMRMLGDVPIQVVLGSEADGALPVVSLARAGTSFDLPCVMMDEGGVLAQCGLVGEVEPGEEISLSVTAGNDRAHVRSIGSLPEPGLGWSLLDGVQFTALGGGSAAVSLANDYLVGGNAFAAIDGYDGAPGVWTMVGGPSGFDTTDGIGLVSPGLTFQVIVDVGEDGTLYGTADTAWLPTYVGTEMVQLLLLDVSVSGRLEGERLVDLVLEANAPALALEALSDTLGPIGSQLLGMVTLNVDRDGDGTADAATLRLAGEPAPAALAAWYE